MRSGENIIIRSLHLLRNSAAGDTAVNTLIMFTRSLLPVAVVLLIKYYVDDIIMPAGEEDIHVAGKISVIVAALAVALLLDDILATLNIYFSRKQSVKLEQHIASLIHKQVAGFGLGFFEDPRYHDMLSRAVQDISWRPAAMISDFMTLLRGSVSFIAMAVILAKFGPVILLLVIVLYAPVLVIKMKNTIRLYGIKKDTTQLSRRASYFGWLLTGERPAREVILFGLSDFLGKRHDKYYSEAKSAEIRVIKTNSRMEILASFIKVAAFTAVLIYSTMSLVGTAITAGEMAMYLLAFRQAMVYLRDAVSGITGLNENRMFMNDLFSFIDLRSDIPPPSHNGTLPEFNNITLENVEFSYPGSAFPALQKINLHISKGEKIAVVGPNGSGKTTLVKILCRLYDPDEGSVLLNGSDINIYEPEDYRRLFSVVFQDFMLYYMTAGENITFSDQAGGENEQRMKKASAMAGISQLLESMPEGYGTMLGHHSDQGRELSWGEWQKIALARALYRDTPLLVLDEPSSSLDADSEYEIFSRMNDIAGSRTTIMISHRLANVKNADRIILLEKGVIAETGTHEELMSARGKYYSMYSRQKEMYE